MREIKYRAWDKQEKRIVPVYTLIFGVRGLSVSSAGRKLVDFELMQYTGLKDKNGKEIYEGDILTVENYKNHYRAMIEMGWSQDNEYGWHWKSNYLSKMETHTSIRDVDEVSERYEVIGNIYENPELLTQAA